MIRDLIISNRSYRRYDENIKIPLQTLKELLDNARLIPSSANLQPIRYYISTTKEMNEKIFPLTKWAGYLTNWDGPSEGERPAAYIVVIADRRVNKKREIVWCDAGIACQTILLTAVEKGFGGCIIGSFDRAKLASIIGLEEYYEPMLIIALGKPKEKVVLEDVSSSASIKYYRDSNGVHHVPKRKLEDILLGTLLHQKHSFD